MKWIETLELKFGRLAIPGLIRIVAAFNALVFVLYQMNPAFLRVLELDPARVLHGEVWRLVSYIFIPQLGGILPGYLSFLLYLLFLWFIGNGLEQAMGAFRVNLYFVLGMAGTTAAAFFFGANFSNVMLTSSLFFAFARFYPDEQIYLFYILPIKVKWMAWVSGLFLILGFITESGSYRMAVLAALSNYLIFFGPQIWQEARHRTTVAQRRQKFETARTPDTEALHCCVVCKRTDITHPELDFRVSGDGNDYCAEHRPVKS